MSESLASDLSWFRAFVEQSRWQFARTYVETYPHEYTIVRWGGPEALAKAVREALDSRKGSDS